MNWEAWVKEYPPMKARSEPPCDSWYLPEPFVDYLMAKSTVEHYEREDNHGGLIVVEWNHLYYVCYDESYGNGFADYEHRPEHKYKPGRHFDGPTREL